VLYILFYYVPGYRKKVVLTNLRNAFPEKKEGDIQLVAKKFYHYLCDLFLETFKTLTISEKQMLKHCRLAPSSVDLFSRFQEEGRSVVLVMGHLGNWEWAGNSFSLVCKQQLYVIYHPLANKNFNGLICKMRTRFGTKLINMDDTFREMVANKPTVSVTAFIADQTPPPQNAYWTKFLNQDTPVFWGTERIACKLDYPVVYVCIKKTKRGYYEFSADLLVETPSLTTKGEISEMHTRRLEKDIIDAPDTWLWSHRRWKHKKPVMG